MQLKPDDIESMFKLLLEKPSDFLFSPRCRQYLARARWRRSEKQVRSAATDDLGRRIVDYAKRETTEDLFNGPHSTNLLLGPLMGIAPVSRFVGRLKVLSVGPRTEMEIFHLMAIGFAPENIRAIDLVSTSPMIDAGDMHAMPYQDNSFDVVIANNSLGHSPDPVRAVDEMARVCRNEGLIALAQTYYEIDETFRPGPSHNKFARADDFTALLGEHAAEIILRQDAGTPAYAPAKDTLLICRTARLAGRPVI